MLVFEDFGDMVMDIAEQVEREGGDSSQTHVEYLTVLKVKHCRDT